MAEVIRRGQTMSTRKIEPRDIIIKATPKEILTRGFVSGGGSGGRKKPKEPEPETPIPTPTPTETTSPSKPKPTLREEAKESGVSEDIQRVREQAERARRIREEARRRKVDISTPVRQKGFIEELKREEQIPKVEDKKMVVDLTNKNIPVFQPPVPRKETYYGQPLYRNKGQEVKAFGGLLTAGVGFASEKAKELLTKVQESKSKTYLKEKYESSGLKKWSESFKQTAPSRKPQEELEKSYKQLYFEGDLPGIIRKTAYEVGGKVEKYISSPIKRFKGITGKGISLETTPAQEKRLAIQTGQVLLFGGFSPLMSTGTYAQESVYADDIVEVMYKGKLVKVTRAEAQRMKLTGEYLSDYLRSGNQNYIAKADRLKVLLRNLKNPNDPVAVKKIMDLAQETYGKTFVKDFLSQEYLVSPVVKSAVVDTTSTGVGSGMSQVGTLSAGVINVRTARDSLIDVNQIKKTSWVETTPTTATKTGSKLKSGLVSGLSSLSKTEQAKAQQSKQDTATDTALKSLSALSPQLKTKQELRQQQRTKQGLRPRPPQKQKQEFKPPIPPKLSLGIAQRIAKKVEAEPDLFKVFARRFGRDIELLKTPSKKRAEQKLKSFLKTTLGRSGFISKNDKPLKFKELGLFQTPEFRPSKKSSTRIVQRKEFSLGTGGEVAEIQYFKKRKSKRKKRSLFGI